MLSTVFLLGLLFSAVPVLNSCYPPDDAKTSKTFCNHELSVEIFATAFYASVVAKHGFDVVAGIEASGSVAAHLEYNTVLEILQKEGVCYVDAHRVAKAASKRFASMKTLPLAAYLETLAHETGGLVKKYGLLQCSNAIPRAFDFFKFFCEAFDGSKENKFGSYLKAGVQGLVDFILDLGLDLDTAATGLFDLSPSKNCTKSKD